MSEAEAKAEDEEEEAKEKERVAAEVEGAALHRDHSATCGGTASGQGRHLREHPQGALQHNGMSRHPKQARNGLPAKAMATRARREKANRKEAPAKEKEKARVCAISGKRP